MLFMLILVGVYLQVYIKYVLNFLMSGYNESTFQKQHVNVDLTVWDDT